MINPWLALPSSLAPSEPVDKSAVARSAESSKARNVIETTTELQREAHTRAHSSDPHSSRSEETEETLRTKQTAPAARLEIPSG